MARRDLDRYYTPAAALRHLVAAFPALRGRTLLDPCAGDGSMARALLDGGRFQVAYLNDLDPEAPVPLHLDACDPLLYATAPDWVVTNPPFTCAGDIAKKAIDEARVGVALLLRCTFLERCKASPRAPRNGRLWLADQPPTHILSIPRISFTGDGSTDTAPTWWFVWLRGAPGTILFPREPGPQLALLSEVA
jgi:hypothetical protein